MEFRGASHRSQNMADNLQPIYNSFLKQYFSSEYSQFTLPEINFY